MILVIILWCYDDNIGNNLWCYDDNIGNNFMVLMAKIDFTKSLYYSYQ
jgi:hypothetical protein